MEVLAALVGLATIFLSSHASAVVHTDPVELQAVYDIMAATGNAWASDIPDVCKSRWHGIECSQADSLGILHVTSLSFGTLSDDTAFPSCSQNAFISPAVARLSHLKRLFFYQCCRANPQPIPPMLASLGAKLEVLVLRQNGHVGGMPAELGANLTNLRTLDLHGNALTYSIPPELGLLSNLLLLDLSQNQLQGELPISLGQLSALEILDLSYNSLQGSLSKDLIAGLISLKKLDLRNNRFTGAIPASIQSLSDLLLLDLSNNAFHDALPPSLGQLKSLQTLILDNAGQIGSPIPISFRHLASLQVLVMTSAGLVGPIPDIFGDLRGLRVVRVDDNRLNGSIPASLGGLGGLGDLRLDGNLLTGPLPFSREFVWRLGRRLRVYNNSDLCFDFPAGSLAEQGIRIIKSCANPNNNTNVQQLEEESPPAYNSVDNAAPYPRHQPPNAVHTNPFTAQPLLQASAAAHRLSLLFWFKIVLTLLLV